MPGLLVHCPSCKARLAVPALPGKGQRLRCTSCNKPFELRQPEPVPPVARPAVPSPSLAEAPTQKSGASISPPAPPVAAPVAIAAQNEQTVPTITPIATPVVPPATAAQSAKTVALAAPVAPLAPVARRAPAV